MATLVIYPRYEAGESAPHFLNVFRLREWTDKLGIDVEYMKRMSDKGEIRLKLKATSPLPDEVFETTVINETPVQICAPAYLNRTKAYIYHPEIKFVSDQELERALKNDGVVKAEVNRELRRATLSFNRGYTPQLPHTVVLGWDRVRVKPLKPRPRRCYCCQSYGHVAAECNNPPVCARCAGKHEEDEDNCRRPKCCAACGGNHTVFDVNCKVWEEECEIARIRHTEKISYRQALLRRKEINQEDNQSQDEDQQDDTDTEDTEEDSQEEEEDQAMPPPKKEDTEPKPQKKEAQVQQPPETTQAKKLQIKRPNTRGTDEDTCQPSGGWQTASSRKKRK